MSDGTFDPQAAERMAATGLLMGGALHQAFAEEGCDPEALALGALAAIVKLAPTETLEDLVAVVNAELASRQGQ